MRHVVACHKSSRYKMNLNVSVLEAGFLWRVRVPQGPAARRETFTSVLSVVQVRLAGPGWLTDGSKLPQCPSHKSRPLALPMKLALVYLLATFNQWTHIPPGGPPLPHSTAKHWGNVAAPQQPRSDLDMTTSVEQENSPGVGFLVTTTLLHRNYRFSYAWHGCVK
jgi:hypothetical protein